jgi:hypothetical protein
MRKVLIFLGLWTHAAAFDWQSDVYSGVFRNIRVTDPRPVRYLFGFKANGGKSDSQIAPLAGLRFENIEYRHPHAWAWKNRLLANPGAPTHHWYFDHVFINGKPLDFHPFIDKNVFGTENVADMIYK